MRRFIAAAGSALALSLAGSPAWAGPEVVEGPGYLPECFAPWADDTQYFQWEQREGPYRIALVNGFVGNTWSIQMVQTAKAFVEQPGIKENVAEFKVISTGTDAAAKLGAIEDFINQGFDAIVTIAVSPDGKKLFVVGEEQRGELMKYDAKTGQFHAFLAGISPDWVAFSRDGQWLAYTTLQDGILWRERDRVQDPVDLTPSLLQLRCERLQVLGPVHVEFEHIHRLGQPLGSALGHPPHASEAGEQDRRALLLGLLCDVKGDRLLRDHAGDEQSPPGQQTGHQP